MAVAAVPEQAFDLLEEAGGEPAQALFRPELEDTVRLEPGRLGAPPLAGPGGRLEPVEGRGDHIEIGGLGGFLPLRGEERVDERTGLVGRTANGVG